MTALRYFVWLLGALGCVLCVAGSLGVWYVQSRVDRARGRVFERVDQSLAAINRRLDETQNVAAKLKINVTEIDERMRDWTKNEISDRLDAKFDVAGKTQQLSSGLQQVEALVDLSHETVEHVRQLLEAGAELGLTSKADLVDPLLERIADIKDGLRDATATVESLAQQFGEGHDNESMGERAGQAAKIAARLLATFGNVDSRLTSFQERSTEAQAAINRLNAQTHVRILAASVCATLFLLWMAAGQFCLCRWARNG